MTETPGTETTRTGRRAVLAGGGLLSLGAALFGPLDGADAATFNVTNTNDSGAGSLRQAIEDANAAGGPDEITFAAGLGTIVLSSVIEIGDDLTISGPATISGDGATAIFYIAGAGDVTITGVTFVDGSNGSSGGAIRASGSTDLTIQDSTFTGNESGDNGGAIYFGGYSLTVEDSVFTDNTAADYGGGLAVHTDSNEPISIRRSTFSGNESTYGGGVSLTHAYNVLIGDTTISGNTADNRGGGLWEHVHYNSTYPGASLVMVNSTVSGNAASYGGGIGAEGDGHVELHHSTITANTATDGGGGTYFGLYDDNAAVLIDHTIVSGNTGPGNTADVGGYAESDGAVTIVTSLIGVTPDAALFTDGGGNAFDVDALLGPLQDNGGPTQTHLPLAGSPAIDTGDPAFAGMPTDQRGLPRVVGAAIDKGSVEVQAQQPPETTTTSTPAPPTGPAQPVPGNPSFTG